MITKEAAIQGTGEYIALQVGQGDPQMALVSFFPQMLACGIFMVFFSESECHHSFLALFVSG
jgi:hypothetical protein